MDRIRTHPQSNLKNQIAPQIALRSRRGPQPVRLICMENMQCRPVHIRVHRHRLDAHLPARTNNPQRNLTAVCHQNFSDRRQ